MTPLRAVAVGLVVLAAGAPGCSTTSSVAPTPPQAASRPAPAADLETLTRRLAGTWTNSRQVAGVAGQGVGAEWMHVELHVVPITAPPFLLDVRYPDARVFYIEQAEVGLQHRPYRQHISVVRAAPEGAFITLVHTFTGDPLRFAGWWRTPERFATITPSDVEFQAGCELVIRPADDGRFEGATMGTGCPNTSRGATYATSEIELTPTQLRAWDRGFDASGRQVWGSKVGPYVFERSN